MFEKLDHTVIADGLDAARIAGVRFFLDEGLRVPDEMIPPRAFRRFDTAVNDGVVDAIGFATHVVFPNQRFNLGVRFFEEFANRAAYQGYSFQLSGAISF